MGAAPEVWGERGPRIQLGLLLEKHSRSSSGSQSAWSDLHECALAGVAVPCPLARTVPGCNEVMDDTSLVPGAAD